jgi:putative lipoic acid-binding regulatory protein
MDSDDVRIEFPCEDYPVKILGEAAVAFREHVLTIVERHAPGFDSQRMEIRDSKNGNYQSITLYIRATGPEQLSNLNTDLRTNSLVKMVL